MSLEILQCEIQNLALAQKPIVVFCIYGVNRIPDEYFRAIYHTIEQDYSLLTITDFPKHMRMPGKVFHLDSAHIETLKGVDIFIVTDNYTFKYPDSSFVLAFPHSFLGYDYDRPLFNLRGPISAFDAYCSATPQVTKNRSTLQKAHEFRINPANIQRPSKSFHVIPTGCPRIATIYEQMKTVNCEQDSILYAPTNYTWANRGERRIHMVDIYGVRLTGRLLEEFPNYRIVFRPCATTWDHKFTQTVCKAHQGNPRFVVSRDYDHMPEFARAAVLLTDYSNIGEVFALSCFRPEIRIIYEQCVEQPQLVLSGYVVNPEGDVMKVVHSALHTSPAIWKSHIQSCFGTYITDPEKTLAKIKEVVACIVTHTIPEGTVVIQRDKSLPAWSAEEYMKHIIFNEYIESMLVELFLKDFPDNKIALFLYIYVQRRTVPSYFIAQHLLEKIPRFSSMSSKNIRFCQLTKRDFVALTHLARSAAAHEHNLQHIKYVDIFEELILKFWQDFPILT